MKPSQYDRLPFLPPPRAVAPVVFKERPNRFLLRCETAEGRCIEAFMPNPGRMRELLLPETRLLLYEDAKAGPERKTRHTILAVERDGAPVFLHTHLNNLVARHLLESQCIPGLENLRVVRGEVPCGRSRFDFLLNGPEGDAFLEVKSCTLFGNGVAMFPDAVTERGRRHLYELAELARSGMRPTVLFLVHTPSARYFMPDFHTDPAFSQAMLDVRDAVRIIPAALEWTPDLRLSRQVRVLEIPWEYVARESHDRGAYLALLTLPEPARIEVGRLGHIGFAAGHWVYVGSAMAGLDARIARHRRITKARHWHIDYLRPCAAAFEALPIRSSRRDECALAQALARIFEPGPTGFGCSDCACATHLFHSPAHPLDRRDFHGVLEQFRMRKPGR